MKGYIEERAIEIARYIIDNNTTVRQAAKHLGYRNQRYIRMLQNVWKKSMHLWQQRQEKYWMSINPSAISAVGWQRKKSTYVCTGRSANKDSFLDKYHYQAWKQLADKIGVYFDEQINGRLHGVSRMDSLDKRNVR